MLSEPVGVAIVTGGASGIGLALTNHLATKNWHVFILDIQAPVSSIPAESTTFLQTDVSDWDQLSSSFKNAYARFSRGMSRVSLAIDHCLSYVYDDLPKTILFQPVIED
jgi:NAD(P)-dependent dehydrogenase (short-subunit alcohol dehydrogenase family)